ELQENLIRLGYLNGKADGVFGLKTYEALVAFQRANRLTADGVAGEKTQKKLASSGAVAAATASPTAAAETPVKVAATTSKPTAARVQYANWYTTVKDVCRKYPYATVYDYNTGINWQIHIFSVGAHADYEPLTANDTSKMLKVFGGNTWNPKAVWVVFADGSVYMASTHSMPHSVQHATDNNFNGHSCLHFPRTQAQVESIGVYATSQQNSIDAGWAETQAMK
ncbi:MAG: peptidoglycan-binding protein, partial [Clostridia bacterium]|nr:peptidoglycan-binding protein [Clostridia bacterium]